jgi:hypothetical protein
MKKPFNIRLIFLFSVLAYFAIGIAVAYFLTKNHCDYGGVHCTDVSFLEAVHYSDFWIVTFLWPFAFAFYIIVGSLLSFGAV